MLLVLVPGTGNPSPLPARLQNQVHKRAQPEAQPGPTLCEILHDECLCDLPGLICKKNPLNYSCWIFEDFSDFDLSTDSVLTETSVGVM